VILTIYAWPRAPAAAQARSIVPTYDEVARQNWWNSMTEPDRTRALEAAGAKPGEAGIAAAWAQFKAPRVAQLLRHPSLDEDFGPPVPKD
jgi:hypothetical protein